MSEENGNNEIVVKVVKDEKPNAFKEVEKTKRELELEEKNEELREKLEIIALAQFESKKRELGCNDADIDTPDKLEAWQKGHEEKKEASGSAPLSYGQMYGGEPPPQKGFNSVEDMVTELRMDARLGDKNAQRILDKLFEKTLKGVKEQEKGVKSYVPDEEDNFQLRF
jgi:hypothetical protein